MKKLLLTALIIISVSTELIASKPTWNVGYVILPDGRKLDGQLNYNWKVEVVQVRLANGLLKAYSAGHVDSFAFFDANRQLLRKFSSVDLADAEQITRPFFFEELAAGPLAIYRRLKTSHQFIKLSRPNAYSDDVELIKDIDNFDYMVINTAGRVVDMAMFSVDVWPQMETYQVQLTEYIASRDVDPSTTIARLLIINHYNLLSLKDSAVSGTVAEE